jgi:cation:H+ antiporter
VPELATAIISKLRGHDEVGLGTILGSNIFNGLFIVAVAALITPITFSPHLVFAPLLVGLVTTALTLPTRDGHIARWRGVVLLGLYALFVGVTLRG